MHTSSVSASSSPVSVSSAKVGVLLVNLGTPNSPSVADVRKYLREFLLDGRVIDINPVARFLLVNGIIAPFRAPKSAKEYRKLWTEKGSPLMFYGVELAEKLQALLPKEYLVRLAMRYQRPSIQEGLDFLQKAQVERIIVFPLFPQYASATTGSVHQRVMEIVSKWQLIPQMTLVDSYPTHPKMIQTFVQNAQKLLAQEQYEHFVFSYHGLPERQLRKASSYCRLGNCCDSLCAENRLCYRAQCFETSRALAQGLGLESHQYSVCFQSRLGKDPWIQPYTEDVVIDLAKRGIKRVLAFSPAFVADCLETTLEVGETYKENFEEAGGEHWQLVESLNTEALWVEAVRDMILEA
ncbi:ferrochelatase [Hugenholtzia roseola]|uniref:ferrochelatase n=1 Tax=Hugenholtzia roseola TaxID=1002 RepID=UPI000479865C|nr:ferrochelatase [Hugenholtzia roseola]